jgi:hypothetical protein
MVAVQHANDVPELWINDIIPRRNSEWATNVAHTSCRGLIKYKYAQYISIL